MARIVLHIVRPHRSIAIPFIPCTAPRARTHKLCLTASYVVRVRTKDYDCFYASCIENERPELKTVPLGIQQKNIVTHHSLCGEINTYGKLIWAVIVGYV